MARRTLASPKVWLLGTAAAVLVGLVLLFAPGPDSAAHDGHTEDLYRFTWNSGSMVTLEEYQFWHWNRYREQRCVAWEPLIQDCAAWQDTGATRERPQDSCAARPEWVIADVVNGAQTTAAAPSGATCNRHDSYLEGNVQWVFTTAGHRTVATGDTQESSEQRCYLPASGIQGPTRSTNTNPPNGEATVYQSSNTKPSQYDGSERRCGGGRLASCTNRILGRPRPPRARMSRPRPRRGRGIGTGRVRMISRWVSRIRRRCRRTRTRG